jgi:hypothetical protein
VRFELLSADVCSCPDTHRREPQRSRPGARGRDELRQRVGLSARPRDNDVRLDRQRRDRGEIVERVVRQVVRNRRAVGMGAGVDQHRVAVGGGVEDERRRCRAPAARMIDHIDPLTQLLRERTRERARHHVRAATQAERLDQAQRSPRGARPGNPIPSSLSRVSVPVTTQQSTTAPTAKQARVPKPALATARASSPRRSSALLRADSAHIALERIPAEIDAIGVSQIPEAG